MDLKLISKAKELMKLKKYDIIIGDYLLPYGFVAHYLSKISGILYVIGYAGSDMTRLLHFHHYNNILLDVIKDSNGIITFKGDFRLFTNITKKDHKILERSYNLPIDQINICSEISCDFYKDIDFSKKTYLHIGKLHRSKGIFELLNAFFKVAFDYNLVFVGNGPHKEEIMKRSEELNIDSYFLDFVPSWCIYSIIKKSDFCLSVEHNFGVNIHAPLIFREVMALGIISILGNQIKNLSVQDKIYFKVNTTNLEDYISVLNKNYNLSEEEYKEMAEAVKDFIIKNNNYDQYIKDYFSFLQNVLK